jgi:2-polyprenyl-6-methoxyphenol hydroxylase-like FAD-dependent oxidoreductase
VPGRRLRVLVSGAGIADAALACLLGRQGHEVTVVERDQAVRSSGGPGDVRGAAFGVVEDLGLGPRLSGLATAVRHLVLVDASGRRMASMRPVDVSSASSAIASAATLARAHAQSGEDVPTALRRYEAEHGAASSRGQRAAGITSHVLVPATRPGLTARNLALRLTGHR